MLMFEIAEDYSLNILNIALRNVNFLNLMFLL